LAFYDRNVDGRGIITCACVKPDLGPIGSFWSDLRFNAKDVLTVWPPRSDIHPPSGEMVDSDVNPATSRPLTEKKAQQFTRQYLDQEKQAGREPTLSGLEGAARTSRLRGGRDYLRHEFHKLLAEAGVSVGRGRRRNSPK